MVLITAIVLAFLGVSAVGGGVAMVLGIGAPAPRAHPPGDRVRPSGVDGIARDSEFNVDGVEDDVNIR
jgi:hypothetical protein